MDGIDEQYLRRAIGLALSARGAGQRPYGALLVGSAGTILAEDHNTVLADRDITAHPELKLARWAAQRIDAAAIRATTMYTSCEPCEMCMGAIARAGIGRVVFALSDEQWQAVTRSGAGGPVAAAVAYEGPALFDEARAVVDGYYA
jgi:tRNA(Arg) A34 adenosine deaminase TadA